MARIEINIKVYRPKNNFSHLKTMTEKQANEYLKEQEQDSYENEEDFKEWLEDNYSIVKVFSMDEQEKKVVDKKWRESCREYVEELFKDDYEEEEIVLSVEEDDLNKYDNFILVGV